jgi:hypothetical protein
MGGVDEALPPRQRHVERWKNVGESHTDIESLTKTAVFRVLDDNLTV